MTTFSLVIPTYNRRDHLMTCLESVFAQRRQPDEIIVVDDGSTDGTREALSAFSGLVVIEQRNAGPGAARNCGASAASSDYLVFLDSDDLWFPWTLQAISMLVERHGLPTLLMARADDFSGDPPSVHEQPAQAAQYEIVLHAAAHAYSAGAGMMAVNRRAFLAVGGFVEDGLNAEDHDIVLRLGDAPGFVQVLQPTTIGRRLHSGNETANLEKSIDGLLRLISKERAGDYPGGDAWKEARRTVIARHVRPVVLQALRGAQFRAAWQLYRCTWTWNARAGRAIFIVAVPFLIIHAVLRSGMSAGRASGR